MHGDAKIMADCTVLTGSNLDHLPLFADCTFDSCVTDPPYLMSTRSTKRPIYDHEFHTEAEHAALLSAILPLSARVMISGYASQLYDNMLATWRRIEFTGVSRGGPTTEVVWCNFPEPAELHDYRFLGETFRQRQDIRRQKDRWIARLRNMPPQKRFAILAATEEFKSYRDGISADKRSPIGGDADSGPSEIATSTIGERADPRDAAEMPLSSIADPFLMTSAKMPIRSSKDHSSAEMPPLAKDGENADARANDIISAELPSSAASGEKAVAGSRKVKL